MKAAIALDFAQKRLVYLLFQTTDTLFGFSTEVPYSCLNCPG